MNAATQSELLRALPFARRYSRALAGSQTRGDAVVAEALRAGLPPVAGHLALYAGVSARFPEPEAAADGMSMRRRQLLLLTALEDLSLPDAAALPTCW